MSFPADIGVKVFQPEELNIEPIEFYFGEDQARYVVSTSDKDGIIALAKKYKVDLYHIGNTNSESVIRFDNELVDISDIKQQYNQVINF